MPSHDTPSRSRSEVLSTEQFVLNCRNRRLECRPGSTAVPGAHVMGILNVTPDSFSDGGQFVAVDDAVSRAAEMLSNGAAVIDVGGESTRPGADPISRETEIDRIEPVIEALTDQFPEALVSIDTYKPRVAEAALSAGAHIVNDVTGLRYDPETADVAAEHGAPLIVMHSVGTPGSLTAPRAYDDVVATVREELSASVATATSAGVEDIVVDPGFGFGKATPDNFRLVNAVDDLLDLGRPVLIGVSRKSSIGEALGTDDHPAPVDDRLFGSLGATAVGVLRGATLVRAHDVGPTVEMCAVLDTTLRQR